MTFLGLARRNAWRKPMRTLLLVLSVAIAFVIFGLLQAFLTGANGSSGDNERLIVHNRAGSTQSLPVSLMNRIESLEGVASVSHATRLRAFVENERNIIGASAVDPGRAAAVFGDELGITPDLITALQAKRDNVLVGRMLARAQGWEVGQKVTITSFQYAQGNGSRDWSFEVAGIFDGESPAIDTYFLVLRYDYFNAARTTDVDMVSQFSVLPEPGVDAATLAPKIDALFANSAVPTRTSAEQLFLQAFIKQIADVNAIVGLVLAASLTTIFMIVVNTMAFAVRERTFEIGVLKAIGLSRKRILMLILSESVLVFAFGGVIGLTAAWVLSGIADPSLGLVLTPVTLVAGAGLTLVLGILSGLIPAVNAMRLPIVQTFRAR